MAQNDLWEENIQKAKGLLKNRKQSAMEIARLTLEACEIVHGGRHENERTLTAFAQEIGVHGKTLANWVSLKKNIYDKLPTELKVRATIGDLLFASRSLARDANVSQVTKTVSNLVYTLSPDKKLLGYIENLNGLEWNVKDEGKIAFCKREVLEQILFLCESVKTHILNNSKEKLLKPINHGLQRVKNNALMGIEDPSKVWKITDREVMILNFLKKKKKPFSITQIYKSVFPNMPQNKAKLQTMRSLNKLTATGHLLRDASSLYKISHERHEI